MSASNPHFGQRPGPGAEPAQAQYPGGPPPPRSISDDMLRARISRSNGTLPTPKEVNIAELKKALNSQGVNAVPNLLSLDSNLRQAGLMIYCDIVLIGESPLDPGGKNQHREQEMLKLQQDLELWKSRALTAERTAADAIREVNDLKATKSNRKEKS